MMKRAINILSLFSGVGGFELGFERAGFTFKKHYTSETNKYCNAVNKKHYPGATELGDIRNIKTENVKEKIDVITFGFPCQDISLAGKRRGLEEGTRSGLVFEAIEIIQKMRPSIFIAENVKGLFSSSGGRDFEAILHCIADIGLYECEWQLLNTKWFLPQNRERIYIIGHLAKGGGKKVFPFKEDDKIFEKANDTKKDRLQTQICNTIREGVGRMCCESTFVIDLKGLKSKTKGGMMWEYETHNLDLDSYLGLMKENIVRRLTPVECARLQGFPDDWAAEGEFDGVRKKISDTEQYKIYGNAVSVPVVQAIAERL